MDLAPLDAALEYFEESSVMVSSKNRIFQVLLFLRATLTDNHKQFVDGDTLKEFENVSREVGTIISAFDLKKMDQDMADRLCNQLMGPLLSLEFSMYTNTMQIYHVNEPRPSGIHYPRTDQLGFVDHLVENIEEVVKSKADSTGPLKRYILRLQLILQFVSSRLMEIPEPRKEETYIKYLKETITNLAYEVEYVIDSFLIRNIPTWCCICWLRDILKETEYNETQVKRGFDDVQSIVNSIINRERWDFNIIPFVINTEISKKLREVLNDPAIVRTFSFRSWSSVSSYIERKKEVFVDLLCNSSYTLRYVHASTKEAAKEKLLKKRQGKLEQIVKTFLLRNNYLIILEDVQDIDVLNDIRRVLPDAHNGSIIFLTTPSLELYDQCRQKVFPDEMSGDHILASQTNKPTTSDDVVGFETETQGMLDLLTGGSTQLRLISIAGMAGQGKTTLAKKLYGDHSVVGYFDTRAWCYVSQSYEKRELLLELLGHVVQLSDTAIRHKTDEELAAMLCRSLRGQRFLVVLDDMWSIRAWNDLMRCFPNDNNGSRILLTTRIQVLASQAKFDSILQSLCPLSDDETMELLRKKVFQKESFPPQLLEVGRRIAKNCRGLPLSVILTAGLLAKMDKKMDQWEHVAKTLSSHILSNAEAHGKGIIELSYKHLPDPIKPCFLYFGAFLEDREVPVSKLVRLWIAEGFIKQTDLKSLEDVAEDYLTDLIGRSLLTVAQESSNGGVKTCRVHDLLREFCLAKAREENFMQQINGYDEHFSSCNDNLDYSVDPNYSYSSTPIIYYLRRLCIYSKRNHFITLKPSGPFVRSLVFFAASDKCPSYSYDISFIFHNFKFLRILDLEDINIGDSFKAIGVLVLLRYLAVQSYVDSIPSSIANLWNLETFLFKGLSATVVKVSDSIWDMAKLRDMHITGSASFDLDPHRLENSSMLHNLQTFSTPSLAYGDDMEKILRRLRGIQKLKCIFLDSWDNATNYNRFPELSFLNRLVSLNVFYNGEGKYPCQFNFPSNLKKLTLSNFHMPWNEISQLAILHNLEVLKLLSNAFEGETWEMEDEVFPKLKFLKLETLNVVQWSALSDNFPCLERLLLHKCKQLEEIPPDIGHIPTLQMIEVMWCHPSAAISARKIQEEQLEFGKGLKIHVYPKV